MLQAATAKPTANATTPRLRAVAIRRNGQVKSLPKGGSHYQLRMSLTGTDQRFLGDVEGFITDDDIFLTRRGAVAIGVRAGQLSERWLDGGRDLLSSDVNWEGQPRRYRSALLRYNANFR